MRITRKNVEYLIDLTNEQYLRIPAPAKWNTVGAYQLGGVNGYYMIEKVVNPAGGVANVFSGSLREIAAYLKGIMSTVE